MVDLGAIGITIEHRELHATARRWVEAHVDPKSTRAALDLAEPELPPFWDALGATGWFGLALPEEFGGEGFGWLELAVVLEELGRACAPGPFIPTVVLSAVLAELMLADAAVVEHDAASAGAVDSDSDLSVASAIRALATGAVVGGVVVPVPDRTPAFVDGADGSNAVAGPEEDGGLVARLAGDGRTWTVDGSVRHLLGGSLAQLLLVPVVAPDALSVRAPNQSFPAAAWVLLDREQAGVSVHTLAATDATRAIGEVRCVGVEVPAVRQLGDVSTSLQVAHAVLTGAESVGSMSWCVQTAAAYACEREQFGRPIGQFQAVKHRCADMAVRLERSRALVWDAARASAVDRTLSAAMVAMEVPGNAFAVTKDCIHVLGGIGYTWEHDAHVHAKRSVTTRQLAGSRLQWSDIVVAAARSGDRRELAVDLPPHAEQIRADVQTFLQATRAAPKTEWNAIVADHGYLVPHWPAPWGRDAGPIEQLVIDEEFDAARLRRPHLQVAAWVLPTIINHGTIAQQERWVPSSLRGEVLWCQLFSEPGAGSDLASLQMRAERVDGGWSLTGQKVWTTMAHLATWGLCLARTSPGKPKHEGITAFVIDMASPGIDCRPLRELTGAALFNEVFFDAVFVPDDCVVGNVDEGWDAARTTLANERVSMGSGSSFGPKLESLVALWLADRTGAVPSVVLSDLLTEGHALAVLGLRATLRALSGVGPGAESSVRKLVGVEHEQAVQEVALDLLGASGAVLDGEAAQWVNGFLGNRALSIAGGTSDIQRNIVAERLLGLPKDP